MTYATGHLDSASGANCSNNGSPCCYKLENTVKKTTPESYLVNQEYVDRLPFISPLVSLYDEPCLVAT
jgi:hypothetical protein